MKVGDETTLLDIPKEKKKKEAAVSRVLFIGSHLSRKSVT
jgi:hypothetical protein